MVDMRRGSAQAHADDVFWIDDVREPVAGREEWYTIGDLSREYDVTLRALRFYEDRGLLSPRRDGLARLYSSQDRARLELILKGKRFGFSLTEIAAMIEAEESKTGEAPRQELKLSADKCLEQIEHLEHHRRDIEQAIVELKRTHDALVAVITSPAKP